MILTQDTICNENLPLSVFSFKPVEYISEPLLELSFFSEKEIELILSKENQEHLMIRGYLQSHWHRHILDRDEYFDIHPIEVYLNL